MDGIIFSIEEFAINDGPGIRTTVFLKGCPLRCAWCHNPEGWRSEPEKMLKKGREELCGYRISAVDLSKRLSRDRDLFRESGGGVTFTGGEPLQQAPFLCEVMDDLEGIHKVVETSGYAPEEVFRSVLERADCMLFDIKLVDSALHRQYTGVGNEPILRNLKTLITSGKPFVARIPLIPGVNDTRENMEATASLLQGAAGLQRVELLRYNRVAGAKYPMVGLTYRPPFDENQAPVVHDAFTGRGMKLLVL